METAKAFADAREPTGPPPTSLWRVIRGPHRDPLERWSSIRDEHGDVARYRYGFTDTYLVASAEGIERVLRENAANYTKDHSSYRMIGQLFGDGLFTSQGESWLRQRRLAQPAFHKQRIAAMGELMIAAALETRERFAAAAAAGRPLPLLREMSRLTLKIVGDALFGTALTSQAATVAASWDLLSTQMAERVGNLRLLPPILPTRYDRDFRRARRDLFKVVDAIITARRAGGGAGDDLLSMFMAARDEDTGAGMSDAQLRDEVVTMLLAGHETTAVALAWTWARLDQHPEVRAQLDQELARVLGGRTPTVADVPRLVYTKAVIDETLRLHPPAYIIIRRAQADDVIDGRRIRRGGVIIVSPLLVHRHPAYWKRPQGFEPERWLDEELTRQRPRFAFIPFSGGPRQCIGNAFSMMESVLSLATLAQRFEVRLVERRLPATAYAVLARPAGDLAAEISAARSPA